MVTSTWGECTIETMLLINLEYPTGQYPAFEFFAAARI
jgi:hypothetical protein